MAIFYNILRTCYHRVNWFGGAVKTFYINLKWFSVQYAKVAFLQEYYERFLGGPEKRRKYRVLKDDYIQNRLKGQLQDVIDRCKKAADSYLEHPPCVRTNIWVFWWDGIETAPEIVQACVKSIQFAAGSHEVVLLDKNTIFDFVDIPQDICEMHQSGKIGHAHFSDILRLSLLAKYGGLWMDATIFCKEPLPEEIWQKAFFTCKMAQYEPFSASHGLWAGWLLGGVSSFQLFAFSRDALIEHWRRNDHLIDYLLMDYIFKIAYDEFAEVRQEIDALESNNPDRHELMRSINQKYEPAFFQRETYLYKMSYRYGKPRKYTQDKQLTYYGYIIDSMLEKEVPNERT